MPASKQSRHPIKRRWRDYQTGMGSRPVKDFINGLDDVDAAAISAAMKDVREQGLVAARHLRGEIYEVRADGNKQIFRILFAEEGKHGHILLSLNGFKKKTRKTPQARSTWRRNGFGSGGIVAFDWLAITYQR